MFRVFLDVLRFPLKLQTIIPLPLSYRLCWFHICRKMAAAESSSDGTSAKSSVKENRLINEKSSYLLQHARNPVDWYPWGQEALSRAKEEDKIIFLSIGYSTCHWCHVMEKESFENKEIAEIMNAHYINIKVDREERPDVDKVYMSYVQATTGSGGWPLNVWLTPSLNPVYGGTYFPVHDRHFGRPGFKTILLAIAQKWSEQKDKIEHSSEAVIKALENEITLSQEGSQEIPDFTYVTKCYDMLSKMYDSDLGGFGKAPKFPQPVMLLFLCHYYIQNPTAASNIIAKEMVLQTLKKMVKGGIHDHVNKGFHRYSTDDEWHVPHFEKMLYDQAQLAVVYATAFQITRDKLFADVARGVLLYVSRDLSDPNGGFYSAEDADSLPTPNSDSKLEGAFCVWTKGEIEKLLNFPAFGNPRYKLYEPFCMYYGVKENGNVNPYQDPHGELKHKNVFIIRFEKDRVAREFGLTLDQLKTNLMQACSILYEARLKRPKPHRDEKMIASWNGLMMSGYAKAGQMLNEKEFIARAISAANFIKKHLYDQVTKCLIRSCYRGENNSIVKQATPIEGLADDYAYVIQGLLDLYEGCGNPKWLEWAEELQRKQDQLFWDANNHGYFMTSGKDSSVILRLKDDQDGAEPCVNSISVMNLLRLSTFLNDQVYYKQAELLLSAFNDRLNRVPHALPMMLCSVMLFHQKIKQIVIAATRNSKDTSEMVEAVHSFYIPNKVLMFADGDIDGNFLYKKNVFFLELIPISNQATVYICEGGSCSLPITNINTLKSSLDVQRQKTSN